MEATRFFVKYIFLFFVINFLAVLMIFVHQHFFLDKLFYTSYKLTSQTWSTEVNSKVLNLSSNIKSKISQKHLDKSKTILFGQFNYLLGNESLWSEIWRQTEYFADIFIAIPKQKRKVFRNVEKILYYRPDGGYVSPYANIGHIIKKNLDVSQLSILYVHDDLLMTGSLLKRIVGGKEWVVEDDLECKTNEKESGLFVWLYENGTYIIPPRKYPQHLDWRILVIEECRDTFFEMFKDSRLKPYLKKDGDGNFYLIYKYGQADMLYLNLQSREQRNELLKIITLFSDHKLFLECAIPTLVYMMQQKFGIRVHDAPLCTSWNYSGLRKRPSEMVQNCIENKSLKFELFHPVKIGISSESWKSHFHRLHSL